jgi:hypothetical protein
MRINGAAGNTRGIRLGTGSTPPTPNDYKLQTLIAHGNSAGQLAHGAQLFTNPWVATPNIYGAIHRIFTNNTASPITVTEVGTYAWPTDDPGPWTMITRDILAAPATIQPGQAYRFILTFCTPVG